ncbi:MAG: PKD domain-containing protein [Bacteroidia bacterium]|nr:PKD domain-containing protein [Bacteroidia bacterium]
MKKLLRLFLFVILSGWLLPDLAHATHIMGVDITYSCTGSCTYRIFHKTYYDCTGGAMVGNVPVSTSPAPPAPAVGSSFQINGIGGPCTAPTPISGWVFQSYSEVTPICPDLLNAPPGTPYPTGCDGNPGLNPNPPINGVVEAVYYIDYSFCNATCDQYLIQYNSCCRNGVISSIDNPAGQGLTSSSTIVDLTITPCNSSPVFNNKPVPYICAGEPFTFNQGATDPDGDSLSYELGECFDDPGIPVPYLPGFTPEQPLGQTWSISINPLTGDITMTPNPTGSEVVGVMCIVVKEWRNGQLIGQVVRDMQITVIGNCASSNPLTGGVQNLVLGADEVPALPLSYSEVRTCAGVEMCFDLPVISQDPSLDYTITWNQSIPGATFTDANNPAIVNTITGPSPTARFCWTPPANLPSGSYFFVVSVQDDACPIPGFNQFTIIIYVEDVLASSTGIGDPVGCNAVQLSALPASTIPGPYSNIFPVTNWTGNGNLEFNPNTSDSSFTHLYPAPGDYFFNLFVQDTFGCTVTIPGVTNLPTGAIANAGPDVTICSNFNFNLGTPAIPGQTYLWSPGTFLSSTTAAQPAFTFPNDSNTQTVFSYVVQVTSGVCTTFDYTTVYVNPSLSAVIQPAVSEICPGDSVTLTAIGNLPSGYTYLWSNGATTQSITVAPDETTTYSVVTFNGGCSSTPAFSTVSVKEGPRVQISGDLRICPGAGATLTANGGASYIWSAGGFTGQNLTIAGVLQDTTIYAIAFDALGCPGPPDSITIRPYAQPVPDFSSSVVCEDAETAFADLSTIAEGAITRWSWTFGAGAFSQDQNPAYTFTAPGLYNVKLAVTSSNGCRDSLTRAVRVEAAPDADFTFTNACEGTSNTFTNTSVIEPGNTVSGFAWSYGDGSTGSGASPVYTYADYGFYNVTLTASTAFGCSDQVTKTVFVHPNPVADFRVISACEDSVVLASTSSSVGGNLDYISQLFWDFGDPASGISNFAIDLQPSHVYAGPGTYNITLQVTTANGCADQITKPVTAYPSPVADFSYSKTCETDQTEFVSLSTSDPRTPLEYRYWDFGDSSSSQSPSPVHSYYATAGSGTYTVYLAVRTTAGCVDTAFKQVVINPRPYPEFAADPVCLNDTTRFRNFSTIVSGQIVSYRYDFGDGRSSADPDARHVYREAGDVIATLSVVSDSGCSNQISHGVRVYELPVILSVRTDTVCFGERALLGAITEPGTQVRWYQSLSDLQPFQTSYSYTTPGLPAATTYYIEPVSDKGCVNTRQALTALVYEAQQLAITPDSAVVELPLAVVNFAYGSTIGLSRWEWQFGDGSGSQLPEPSHEYQYPGIYAVSLRAADVNGCPLTADGKVEVKKLAAVHLASAFTPNGDGINDAYRAGYYNVLSFHIRIFNRWGQLVFESAQPDFEWNGTDLQGAPVQEGVYVYKVEATDLDGNLINDSRTITVLR